MYLALEAEVLWFFFVDNYKKNLLEHNSIGT